MYPDLKLLISLQELDHKIELLNEEAKDQREKIHKKELEIKATQDALLDMEKKEKDMLLKLKKEEEHLKEVEYRIDEKKNELFSGKFTNPKELLGFQKEMKRLEEEKDKKETDIILLMEEYEKVKEETKKLREKSEKVIEKLKRELSDLKEDEEKIQRELENSTSERKRLEKEIDERYYMLYEEIRKEKSNPIAEVHDNTCTGCHLVISGDTIDKVKKGKDIVTCPHCGRILYYRGE